jgi:hypothetical protein
MPRPHHAGAEDIGASDTRLSCQSEAELSALRLRTPDLLRPDEVPGNPGRYLAIPCVALRWPGADLAGRVLRREAVGECGRSDIAPRHKKARDLQALQ